jgi:SulP family sulfate permease
MALAALALAILWGFPTKWRKFCPPHLIALLAGTLASLAFLDHEAVRRVGPVSIGLPTLHLPVFTGDQMMRIVIDALVLGVLGCIDTLLTAMIADSLTREYHDSNRELVGQGIANVVSGLCGGLPGAGATMGTVVNIQAGARTRLAGVFRALILFSLLLGAAKLTHPIPMAILAAIAFKVGFDILDWSFLKRVHRVSGSSTFLMYGVLLLTVFVDLILAVGAGVFLANLLTIKRLSDLQQAQGVRAISPEDGTMPMPPEERAMLEKAGKHLVLFHLSGPMIFGVAKAISREHAAVRNAKALVLDLKDVPYLGLTVCLAIENMVLDAFAHGARVWVVGAQGSTRARLEKFGFFKHEGLREAAERMDAYREAMALLPTIPSAETPT